MKHTLLLLFIGVSLFSCQKQKTSLDSDEKKVFYTVGHTMGSKMKDLSMTDEEIIAYMMGFEDSVRGKKEQVETAKFRVKIQKLFHERMTKVAEKEKERGKAYLEKYKKEQGVKVTPSGLAYKIKKEGKGEFPKATDKVKVNYKGTLINGEEFDSSYKRGEPVTFPLNRVIKGWTEGVQLIKSGGEIELVIPSDLAYGDQGAGPKIPGGATLIFKVELLEIVKDGQMGKKAPMKSHMKSKMKSQMKSQMKMKPGKMKKMQEMHGH